MAEAARQIKVGLFVFVALVLLSVLIFSISDFYTVQPEYPLRVRFNFSGGIEAGAPVRLAGVDVGEVRSVRVFFDEPSQKMKAELAVQLATQAQIEEDSTAFVNTLGLIGEKYLEIVPGTPGKRKLAPGEILVGKDSISSEKFMESAYGAVSELKEMITSVNVVMADPAVQQSFRQTVTNSSEATDRLNLFLEQANDLLAKVRSGQGTVGRLLTQDELYQDLKALTADLRAHPWKLLYRPKEAKKK
ncbi:MAG: MCE family protein [Candidatus Omnitrophica bacterium]|nr:MCE family protein [Candidatus Omnitrophota bacterium]